MTRPLPAMRLGLRELDDDEIVALLAAVRELRDDPALFEHADALERLHREFCLYTGADPHGDTHGA